MSQLRKTKEEFIEKAKQIHGDKYDYSNVKYVQELDKRKAQLCEENNLPLEYIDYNENVENRVNEILSKHKKKL